MVFKINTKLKEKIRDYCLANGIGNVSKFAEMCLERGFNIIQYGTSPPDNMRREAEGNINQFTNGKEEFDDKGQDVVKQEDEDDHRAGEKEKKVERVEEKKGVSRKTFRVINKS